MKIGKQTNIATAVERVRDYMADHGLNAVSIGETETGEIVVAAPAAGMAQGPADLGMAFARLGLPAN